MVYVAKLKTKSQFLGYETFGMIEMGDGARIVLGHCVDMEMFMHVRRSTGSSLVDDI